MATKDGGSIFGVCKCGKSDCQNKGLTVRGYYAAQALKAIVSRFDEAASIGANAGPVAADAVAVADALLAELAKVPG